MNKKEINTNGHEYVDLDLPSGTLWATCNVGATRPEESGLFFQWGDTVGYTGDDAAVHSTRSTMPFNWGMFKYNSDFESLIRLICPKAILLPKYDAAHVHMGGDWKIPTKEQFEELKEYTTHDWVIVNGTNGRKFTSKKDPSKYIFISASDYYHLGSGHGDNELGCLWSSSLDLSYLANAWEFHLGWDSCYVNHFDRHAGFCVRGVLG